MKALVLATLLGGAAGLWLGHQPPDPESARAALLAQARKALTSDLQTADIERALAAVEAAYAMRGDSDAWLLREQLLHQRYCRRQFDNAEHAAAVHDFDGARAYYGRVDEGCKLHEFAVTRLEQIAP